MEQRKTVSVIIPVYNADAFLDRCLDSVLTQTYYELEIILIDDGSNDRSAEICDDYALKDERVHVIHKENSGVSSTRNVGIDNADGNYILFIDADDYIEKNMIAEMLSCAEKNSSDIVMCGYSIDKNSNAESAQMDYLMSYTDPKEIKAGLISRYYTDNHNGLYSLWNKLISASVFSSANIRFDDSLKRGEDAWFVFQCLKQCRRVDFVPVSFYHYCQNESSVMHAIYDDQYDKWVDMRCRLLKEREILDIQIDYDSFYKEFLYKTIIYCRELSIKGNTGEIRRIINDEFFLKAAKYSRCLPAKVKMVLLSCRCHLTLITLCFLKIWGKM